MKRICITTLEFPPDVGGVGESVNRIARLLLALNYEVHVAVFHSKDRKVSADCRKRASCATIEQDGILVHRIEPAIRTAISTKQDFLSEIYLQLKLLQHQYQFDIFHAFFINETGYLTTLIARENSIPVINSVRGSDLHKHIFNPTLHAQMVWVLENSSWVTFVSQDLYNRATLFAPTVQTKSSVFWNSIEPINFTQLPLPRLVDKLQGLVIGSVGRFRDKKGIEYLLDACVELKEEIDFTLLLVGDFAEKECEYWQQEIASSSISENILITGIVERKEALAYLPHIDIFAIPSLHDGCPNAMLEAMLSGRAIVGTNVDAIGGILVDEVDALVVNPASSEELAIALRSLASQPQLRHKLGDAAKRKAIAAFSPTVEQQHWQEVYHQVLSPEELALINLGVA
ncbi:glycosyltransferase [Gloeocapsopsis sp. IPPAS B-1203]|uniref:glycosyltransferase n=1 Tax=Gloeocapsopsis sp. IPPAS B-1203 TaxID=2049454 RepID=UPI0025A01D60|nr:glycosyltransferase [Gloeocapsopsis sp. IPPAS B-1203]